jgi:two-component system response regulator MtrA
MRILIADGDPRSRATLAGLLELSGHSVIAVSDGAAAVQRLALADGPRMAFLASRLPGLPGAEVVREARERRKGEPLYLVIVAGDGEMPGIADGADDVLARSPVLGEVQVRVELGARMLQLQEDLARAGDALHKALQRLRSVDEPVVVCAVCKKARVQEDRWQELDQFLAARGGMTVSHDYCSACYDIAVARLRVHGGGRHGGPDGAAPPATL